MVYVGYFSLYMFASQYVYEAKRGLQFSLPLCVRFFPFSLIFFFDQISINHYNRRKAVVIKIVFVSLIIEIGSNILQPRKKNGFYVCSYSWRIYNKCFGLWTLWIAEAKAISWIYRVRYIRSDIFSTISWKILPNKFAIITKFIK